MYTYKYIKNILGVLLLIILTSNCDSSKHFQDTSKITLAQLEHQLKSGPIFIGENHSNKFANNAIVALIKKGVVKKIFIELPNNADLPNEEKAVREACKKQAAYLSNTNRIKDKPMEQELKETFDSYDEYKYGIENGTGTLLQTALEQGDIAIYFHDVPSIGGRIWINGKSQPDSYGTTTDGAIERNKYSAKLIRENGPGTGTIVLAGMSHLDPSKMEQDNTLQAILGCGNDRVFDLTVREAV